jgi:hypothetical protein
MLGYVTKDEGLAHYRLITKNVTTEEMANGREDRRFMKTTYDEGKMILSQRNMISELYKFTQRSLHPIVPPAHFALLYMLQSGCYICSPDFVSHFQKIDLLEMNILWTMIYHPEEITIKMVLQILFNPK